MAPAAAVAVWWTVWQTVTLETRAEWLVLLALAPLAGAFAWTFIRARSVLQTALISVGMVACALVFWYLSLLILLLVAGFSCPEGAHECPI